MSQRLLIVDDHEMVREGLRYALGSTDFDVIEAANGEAALKLLLEEEVDIVLLDLEMPGLGGLEVLSRIKQQNPEMPVLIHSCHDSVTYVARSFELGAAAFLTKSPDLTRLLDAIRIALAGGTVWTPTQLRQAAKWPVSS